MNRAVWRAPGRVNLIGEHTDYNEGFVLPIALPLGVTCTAAARNDGVVSVRSTTRARPVSFGASGLEPRSVGGWAAYVAGVVWALGSESGLDGRGVDITVDGDVPSGAGLSSSAALECAVATALNELFQLGLTDERIIAIARRAENDYVGVPSGALDQSASVLCRAGHALLLDCRDGSARQLPLDLDAAGLTLLVIDTRAPHRLVDGEYAARRSDCERAAGLLGVSALRDVTDLAAALASLPDGQLRRRVRHVVTENDRVLQVAAILDGGSGPRAIGDLLTASHRSLRDDYAVSSVELDLAVDCALAAGALGARMTGGGFGGSAIALVEAAAAARIGAAVVKGFGVAALPAPHIFSAAPSAGARRC